MKSKYVAFMSYAHFDDQHDKGNVTEIREQLSGEVRAQTGEEFTIFQDKKNLGWGNNWARIIYESLNDTTFLIPIITPSFFRSEQCRSELKIFMKRESGLNRDDLIFPIYYIDSEDMKDDSLAKIIFSRQYCDWREFRFEKPDSNIFRKQISSLANHIKQAMKILDHRQTYEGEAMSLANPDGSDGEISNFKNNRAKSVYVVSGNLFIASDDNTSKQITFAGVDSAPYLSGDKTEIVFLRDFGDRVPEWEKEFVREDNQRLNQIWIINATSLKEECILKAGKVSNLRSHNSQIYTDVFGSNIGQIYEVIISFNSRTVYFLSRAWVTSGAIFSINRTTKDISFLTDGSYLDIVSTGNFIDRLITRKHKYNSQGGSYDFYYIIDQRNGKELKTIGEDLDNYIDELK